MKKPHWSIALVFALIILGLSVMGLSVLAQPALAENEVGNGGDVLVCRDPAGTITTVELLDFFEARTFRGIPIDLGDPSLPVEGKLALALSRLERFSPQRAARYRAWLLAFWQEAALIPGIVLEDIPDSAH